MIKRFRLDPENLPKMAASDLEKIDQMTDADIDYSDIPELDDDFFKNTTRVLVESSQHKGDRGEQASLRNIRGTEEYTKMTDEQRKKMDQASRENAQRNNEDAFSTAMNEAQGLIEGGSTPRNQRR